ncbi:MAG: RecX family transcriptional regulator [Acidobacteriota bacterium]
MQRTPGRKQVKLLEREALTSYAAQALAARAQSVSELRTRLLRKASRKEDVEEILGYLKESGYMDDKRFAGSFAEWRKENQGLGKARVVRDLMARRVAPAVAQAAAESVYQGTDEVTLIEAFLARKYRGKNLRVLLAEPKNLASAYRKLRTGGFSGGNSIRVLKRYAAMAEEIEEDDGEAGS